MKVTGCPKVDGLTLDVTAVVVALNVEMVRHQPPLIDPASPLASSTTHRLHTPLPLAPLKVASVVAPLNTGAGAGQTVFHIHLHLLGGRKLDWPPG